VYLISRWPDSGRNQSLLDFVVIRLDTHPRSSGKPAHLPAKEPGYPPVSKAIRPQQLLPPK
jgi:hypothetical protein